MPDLDLKLDTRTGELSSSHGSATLSPRSLRLLLYLIANRDRVVSRGELLREVWDGLRVSDAAVRQALRLLRRELEPVGPIAHAIRTVRGRGVRWTADAPQSREPTATLPFVGRERELAEILDLVESARAGQARRVLLSGPAGIGKTRLLEELCARVRQRGFGVATARCADVEGAPALRAWEEILQTLASRDAGLLTRLSAADARALGAEFPTLAEGLREDTIVEPGAGRLRLFEAVCRALHGFSSRRPLLVAIDDLHRADGASLRLLDWVAQHLRSHPVLLLVTCRDGATAVSEELSDVLARLPRGEGHRIALRPLAREDVSSLALRALATSDAQALDRVWKRSGGNPFLLRVAIEESRRRAPSGTLSASARESVLEPLAGLSRTARRVLAAASVGGDEIRTRVLERVTGIDPASLADALEEISEAGLLERRGDLSLRFSHALVAEALQQSHGAGERAHLHARWARSLADLGAPAATIAEHAFQARAVLGDEAAAQACREAAGDAARRFAFEEAARLYARAAECLAGAPTAQQLPVLQELTEMQARARGATGARESAERVIGLARETADGEALARAVQSLAVGRGVSGDRPDLAWIRQLEEAVEVYRQPTRLRARLLSELAEALWFSDERSRARTLVREGLALAEATGDPDAILPLLTRAYRILHTGTGDEDMRREICARVDEVIPATRDRGVAIEALHTRFWESIVRGDLEGIRTFAGRVEQEYAAVGGLHARWWTLTTRTSLAFLEGRLDDAEAASFEGLDLGREAGIGGCMPNHGTQILSIRREQGRLPEIEPLLAGMSDAMPGNPGWAVSREMVRLAAGRIAPAREFVRAFCLQERFAALGDDVSRLPVIVMLGDMASALREEEVVAALLALIEDVPEHHVVAAAGFCHWGSLAGLRGRLAAAVGDWDAAIEGLELGLARDRAIRAVIAVARGQIALARALEARGRPADRPRARELLAAGRSLAEDLGGSGRWAPPEAIVPADRSAEGRTRSR